MRLDSRDDATLAADGHSHQRSGDAPEPLHRTSNIEHRTPNIEHRTSNTEHRTPNIEHRTSNTEHRTPNIEHRTSNTEHRTPNIERLPPEPNQKGRIPIGPIHIFRV